MGSHLSLTLVYTFLVYFEMNWLLNCPSGFKSHNYRHYVDDIFVLLISLGHLGTKKNKD